MVKKRRLAVFIVVCILFMLTGLIAMISEWNGLQKFYLNHFPLVICGVYGVAILAALADVAQWSDGAFAFAILAISMIPWLLAILSAVLGAKVKKGWHIMAVILFCGDMLLNLLAAHFLAILIDIVLLILVCITSSASDFWEV